MKRLLFLLLRIRNDIIRAMKKDEPTLIVLADYSLHLALYRTRGSTIVTLSTLFTFARILVKTSSKN